MKIEISSGTHYGKDDKSTESAYIEVGGDTVKESLDDVAEAYIAVRTILHAANIQTG